MGTPERVGPYRILGPLGSGGMGLVFLAEHGEDGRRVALKTVRVDSATHLAGIRREIHALARLEHPGIVRIVDEGLDGGTPWYAMELIEGSTLRSHVKSTADLGSMAAGRTEVLHPGSASGMPTAAWDRGAEEAATVGPGEAAVPRRLAPAEIARIAGIVQGICDPLAYMHGEGLVHRDLKPDNVLIAARGPVIVDFGLTTAVSGSAGRELLEEVWRISGTAAYMSPEQARGELVDARTDLYALGCILFELLTGAPPFAEESPRALLWAHATRDVPRLSDLLIEVPVELEALVDRLLAKEPRDRFGHAEDVARVLERLDVPRRRPARKPRPFVYRPRLVQREPALDAALDQLEALDDGRGSLLAILGESGAGKTRFALEVARMASSRRAAVLLGSCPEGRAPLGGLASVIEGVADRCREEGQLACDRVFGARGPLLALYVPSVAGLPGQAAQPRPVELSARAASLRLFDYVASTLAAFTEGAPLVAVLDDAQWADELTLGCLDQLLHRLARMPLLVVLAGRTDEPSGRHDLLQRLATHPAARRIQLPRLDEAGVDLVVRDMLAVDTVPAQVIAFLARETQGSPFLVGEYVRGAIDQGLLARDDDGRWQIAGGGAVSDEELARLPVPRTLASLLERRIGGASESARRLLAAMAVLGTDVPFELLAPVTAMPELELFTSLQELVTRHVLEDARNGFRFVQHQLRQRALELLAPRERAALHRAAASAIEEAPEVGGEDRQAVLARHYEGAGLAAEARGRYLAAAEEAMRRHAHDRAEALLRAYLRLVARPTPESIRARLDLSARVLQVRGRMADSARECEQAIQEARAIGDESLLAAAGLGLGVALRGQDRNAEARALYEQALVAGRQLGDRKLEGEALSNLGILAGERGDAAASQELFERGLAIARELAHPVGTAISLCNLATLHAQEGRLEQARTLYAEALQVGAGPSLEGFILVNVGALDERVGDDAAALAAYTRNLEIVREIGDRRYEGHLLGSIAGVRARAGEVAEARRLYAEGIAASRDIGDAESVAELGGKLAALGGEASMTP